MCKGVKTKMKLNKYVPQSLIDVLSNPKVAFLAGAVIGGSLLYNSNEPVSLKFEDLNEDGVTDVRVSATFEDYAFINRGQDLENGESLNQFYVERIFNRAGDYAWVRNATKNEFPIVKKNLRE